MRSLQTWLLVLCLPVTMVRAQNPTHWLLQDITKMPSYEVYGMVQDTDGMLWFACESGLYRYNGMAFQPVRDSTLKGRSVSGLTVDEAGRIYGYTFRGEVFQVKDGRMRQLEAWKALGQSHAPHLCMSPEGKLILACLQGTVFAWDPETENLDTLYHQDNAYFSECWYYKGLLHVMSDGGLLVIKPGHDRAERITNPQAREYIDLLRVRMPNAPPVFVHRVNGTAWKAEGGTLKPANLGTHLLPAGLKITLTYSERPGEYWFLTYDGVFHVIPETGQVHHYFGGTPFSYMFRCREGIHWFTTLRRGVIAIPTDGAQSWPLGGDLLSAAIVNRLAADANGQVWFGTNEGVLGHVSALPEYALQLHSEKGSGDITAMYSGEHGILICRNHDVLRYTAAGLKPVNTVGGPKDIECLHNTCFVASSLGMYSFALNDPGRVSKHNHLWTRDLQAYKNRLWYSDPQGIHAMNANGTQLQTYSDQGAIQSMCVHRDSLFALSADGAVFRFDGTGFTRVLKGRTDGTLYYRLRSSSNGLLLCSAAGLTLFDTQTGAKQKFCEMHGLLSPIVYDALENNGHIWLGTAGGLQRIPVDALFPTYPAPQLVPGEVRGGVSDNGITRLSYGEPLFIALESVAYRLRGRYVYEFRLNQSPIWQRAAPLSGSISFSALPPGQHRIAMRIASEDGSIHSNAVYVNVVVDAPYWQRWWFNALIAVAALVVAFLLFWIRSRWIRKREMRALEKERLMHAIRVSRLTAIQSQMNPHFLFNALNSIQSFIYQNDKQSAATYLGKFSDLVRAVLSYSDKPTVPLAAELDIIRWYVALEGLQLDAPVEPEIHVDPAVDADFVEIPPLLLQPYAENSMKHGLRHKRGPKKLVIRIEPISRGIRVIMEDNGVGRKASAAINQSAPKTHASFATSANSERLSLLNREDGEKVSVQIEDLYDADSQPAGTRVTLNLLIAAE